MLRYANESAVTVTLDSADKAGNPINAATAEYRVVDETGADVVARVAVPGFTAGDTSVTINVTSLQNTLAAGSNRALRKVYVYLTAADGTSVVNETAFIIETQDYLQRGSNSFQTYEEAIFKSLDIPNLDSWDAASDQERKAALVAAYHQMVRLTFVDDDGYDIYDIADYTSVELDAMTTGLYEALKRAQIVEADELMSGDGVADLRRDGLMASSIGEVSQMFRPGKPILLPISRRALRYLAGYVSYAIKTTRG